MFDRLLIFTCFTLLVGSHFGCTKSSPTPPEPKPEAAVASSTSKTLRITRESLPEGAPKWLSTRITTLKVNDTKMLEATGVVFGIPNRELAVNAASSRALHEISDWLQSSNIKGLKVIETAFSAERHWAAARVQVPLPKDWTPPTPLPESRLP